MKPEDITAWALNELTQEEREQIEAALGKDTTAQQQARSTKAFCALLSEHLVDEDAAFTEDQRNHLKALELPKIDNVVPFNGEAEPARMNGKAFHAKVNAAREVTAPKANPWLGIAALAACLMFTLFVVNEAWKLPSAQPQAVASAKAPVFKTKDQFANTPQIAINSTRTSKDVRLSPAPAAKPAELAKTITAPPVPGSAMPSLDSFSKPANAPSEVTGLMPDVTLQAAAPASPPSENPVMKTAITGTSGAATTKSGNGTLAFSGSIAYTGGTTLNSGGYATVNQLAPSNPEPVPSKPAASSASTFSGILMPSKNSTAMVIKSEGAERSRNSTLFERTEIAKDFEAPQIPQNFGDLAKAKKATTPGTERYAKVIENPFLTVASQPLSTFSIDVDTASYANVRRFLNEGRLPPPDAVRLEEMINYFPYAYEQPASKELPFSVQVDVAEAPWAPEHRLARVAIKGRDVGLDRAAANFVFLVDVSGSMDSPERLPLVKMCLEMLTRQLRDDDHVSIVTYAGNCGVALESTSGKDKNKIMGVVRGLRAGGSTNGESGITMAYEQAQANFVNGGINRVVLCTDGDFNVGVSDPQQLEKLIKEKAKGGTFLSVLGYGTGNLQDRTMQTLADNGNGNYAYIDSLGEARKVLVEQMQGTLITIAKDVKIQVEFNPAQVASYRLIGYEKRMLAAKDFNNDKKDAGEIGAGHTITALYEIVPVGVPLANGALAQVDDLKYQPKKEEKPKALPEMAAKAPLPKLEGINDETMTVKLRYKEPDGKISKLIEYPVHDAKKKLESSSKDFRFATAVAGFGMLLRDSEHVEDFGFETVRRLALSGKGDDALGYRGEFIQLIDKAQGLKATGN